MLAAADITPHLSWNLVDDVRRLFEFPFMVNAFRAGTIVAVVASLVGWFVVLRRQTYAGHTLAVVGFPGAAGATLIGIAQPIGFFVFCLGAAGIIAAVPHVRGGGRQEEGTVIGTVQAVALACGFLFLSLYGGNLGGLDALLFGTFLGITSTQVLVLLAVGVVTLLALAVIARPLFFASVDTDVARARGVPVQSLGVGFLLLGGAAVAETAQITGALLVFALLVLPAATAEAITTRPARSAMLTVVFALGATWLGLAAAYYSPYPVGFWITTMAFVGYVAAKLSRLLSDRVRTARTVTASAASGLR